MLNDCHADYACPEEIVLHLAAIVASAPLRLVSQRTRRFKLSCGIASLNYIT